MFLSNIELYFTPPELIKENNLFLTGEEHKHITKVMRHTAGDVSYPADELSPAEQPLPVIVDPWPSAEVMAREPDVSSAVMIYLNRLSDLLFVMARVANGQGASDVLWSPGRYAAGEQPQLPPGQAPRHE